MTIIVALILFGIIILIHELGHFIFAKRSGIKVHEFAIGMGPKIFSIKKDTEYSIRLLPLGGFISMEGEDEASNDPRAFSNKRLSQRAATIFAGPLFNIIFAIIILIPVFLYSGFPTTTLADTIDGGVAKAAGIKAGDTIQAINGIEVSSWEEITSIINSSEGEELDITINRDKQTKEISVTPQKGENGYVIGIQTKVDKSFIGSIKAAVQINITMMVQMFKFLGQVVTGTVPGGISNSVAGPVGVIGMVSNAAKTGFINVMYFASMISLNLGIINLLPIPALDGSRLALIGLEAIRGGKKLDPNKEATVHAVGFLALMAFMLFITYKDILRLI